MAQQVEDILPFDNFLSPHRPGRRESLLVRGSPFTVWAGSIATAEEVTTEVNDRHDAHLRLILPDGDQTVFVLDRGEEFTDARPLSLLGERGERVEWTTPRYIVMSSLGATIRKRFGKANHATNIGFSFAWPGDRLLADPDLNGRFCDIPLPVEGMDPLPEPLGTIMQFGHDGSISLSLTSPDCESRPIIVPSEN